MKDKVIIQQVPFLDVSNSGETALLETPEIKSVLEEIGWAVKNIEFKVIGGAAERSNQSLLVCAWLRKGEGV